MQFWEINQSLNDKHIADMKKFAVKVFSNVHQNYVLPNFEIKQYFDEKSGGVENLDKEAVQQTKGFIAWEQQTYDMSVGDYLHRAFPTLFQLDLESENLQPTKNFKIICHGLIIDLKTPLYWLQLNMSYLDNFLYLSFHSQ